MTGNELKEAIRKQGITQEEAAKKLNTTRRTLQNWFSMTKLDANISQKVKEGLNINDNNLNEIPTKKNKMLSESYVPLLPISAQGGSLTDFIQSIKDEDCEKIISPIEGATFAISVSGDSMAPEYPSGSQVLIKKINERVFIEWGRVYVLDTCNGIVIKKLMPSDKEGIVICMSINKAPEYASFEVDLDNVNGVYRVLLCMSTK